MLIVLGSYNMSHMTLHWEKDNPVICRDQLSLSEFALNGDPVPSENVDDINYYEEGVGNFSKYLFGTVKLQTPIRQSINKSIILREVKFSYTKKLLKQDLVQIRT